MKTIHLNFCKVPKECTCYGKYWTELLAQYQNQDYQEVLDLELMKREEIHATGNLSPEQKEKFYRNVFRKELRKAIAEKKGKV